MAFTKLTDDLNIIAKLDDEPNDEGGLTAAALKAKFDEAGIAIQTFINAHIDELASIIEGASGASQVGFESKSAVPETNVQAAIENVQAQIAAAILGSIPNDSISNAQMETAMKKGVAGGVASYDMAFKAYLNILRLKLQQSLSASDIDAWSDIFADASLINNTASRPYMIKGGALTPA
jgi:hypothetical protein